MGEGGDKPFSTIDVEHACTFANAILGLFRDLATRAAGASLVWMEHENSTEMDQALFKFCFWVFFGRAKLVGSLSTVLAPFSAHETIRHTSAASSRGAEDQRRRARCECGHDKGDMF